MRAVRAAIGVVAMALALASCAHTGRPAVAGSSGPPEPDSSTVLLWHMDERAGTRVADSGPNRLDGTAGKSTQTPYGRFGLSRGFVKTLDSFVYLPFDQALELTDDLTIEAWIYPKELGRDEDTPIAGRWTEDSAMQSWLFTLGGNTVLAPVNLDPSPGYHLSFFNPPAPGHLWFVYQPAAAGPPRAFVSVREIELNRWTHVAVTFDGEEVRFYLDGTLDSQFASPGRIRASTAPLLVGNYFDPRTLSRFEGDLRPEIAAGTTPYYAYQGLIDELRISSDPRRTFGGR
jgi:concanavalin A-like lectin/glucanase superfamily protein